MKHLLYTLLVFFMTLQAVAQNSIQYEYDANNRLTKVIYSNGTTVRYTYDALGNRLSKHVEAPLLVQYTVSLAASPEEGGEVIGAGTYNEGEKVQIEAIAYGDYSFRKWSDGNLNSRRTFTIDRDYTLTAFFAREEDPDPQLVFGDVNGDGVVDDADFLLIKDAYLGLIDDISQYDLDGDGVISLLDATIEISVINDELDSIPVFEHEFVDLGLPSGTVWATCNIGAYDPEDMGDHYAWGETEVKDEYTYANYKWNNGYGKQGLDLDDDAARANWGNPWYMPFSEDFRELSRYCTASWTTYNGAYGLMFTAENGKFVFFPAAEDEWCTYWTASTGDWGESEWWEAYNFGPNTSGGQFVSEWEGLPIRPVRKSPFFNGVTTITINGPSHQMRQNEIMQLTAEVLPLDADKRDVNWMSSDNKIAQVQGDGRVLAIGYGEVVISAISTDGSRVRGQYQITIEPMSGGTDNGHQYVDLGLPSGIRWAVANVGAFTNISEGEYWSWGEVIGDYYGWEYYKWCNGTEDSLTKYCTDSQYGTVDNKTQLDPEDDVAYVKWGSRWRMPTYDEVLELESNCTWEEIEWGWSTLYLVTGPNGNSILMPRTGVANNGYVESSIYAKAAYYLSSTLCAEDPRFAYGLTIDDDGSQRLDNRSLGIPVRPVYGE